MQSYRFEVAVRRVYGLAPLIASAASKIAVEVSFLDFPSITVHPQNYAVGNTVTYSVCHKADFRMSSEQAAATFPVTCQCQLVYVNSGAVAGAARWLCPCPLVSQSAAPAEPSLRTYADYAIINTAGETVGYADMSCRVVSQDIRSTVPVPAPAPAPRNMPATTASLTPPRVTAPPTGTSNQGKGAHVEQGRPYILRVVVNESHRNRHSGQSTRRNHVQDTSHAYEALAAQHAGDNRRGPPQRLLSANTAERGTLLHLLQYDVAYQLQSLSETIAAALQREHDVLTRVPLKGSDASGAVKTFDLTESIDQSVASIVRLANIILQVINQLVDNSPAPPHIGTSRELNHMAQQKRNPVNKLPPPADGSVGHYMMYEVLYQLQCLGTNLSYMTVAYRAILDTSLSSIPTQHVEYCEALARDIQHLTKHINILIQSSIDGTLSAATLSAAPKPVTPKKTRRGKEKHAQRSPPATVSQPTVPKPPSVAHRSSSSSHSSFSSFSSTYSRSSTSSSLSSSSSSSLSAPTTPARKPQESPSAAPPAHMATTPGIMLSPSPSATPPNTIAALSEPIVKSLAIPTTSQTQLSVFLPITPSTPTAAPHANQLALPVSQIPQVNNIQPPSVVISSSMSAVPASQSTGLLGTVASSSVPQPVLATGSAPVLNPPYISTVPAPLASPVSLTPPVGAPSPALIPTPHLATPLSNQLQPQVKFTIPVPVPIPQ